MPGKFLCEIWRNMVLAGGCNHSSMIFKYSESPLRGKRSSQVKPNLAGWFFSPAKLFHFHLLKFFSKHRNLLPSRAKNVLLFSSYVTNGGHCTLCTGKDACYSWWTKYSGDKTEKNIMSLLSNSGKIIWKLLGII